MKLKKQQNRGRKHAKILAAMLVFLLCGCNHRDTEYKLSDSTGGSTAETVFGNQKEVDEEQTVSEKSAGETTGIPEKREAQEAAPEETVQVYICGAVASPGVYTLDAIAVAKALKKVFPQEDISLIGAEVCYVHRIKARGKDFLRPVRTAAALLILLLGSALGLTWFHADVNMPQAQADVYAAITGAPPDDVRLITIPYCIGVALGV